MADVSCTIFADNVLEYVFVDGLLIHANNIESEHDSDDPGSHDGETLTLTFSSSSTSIVIKAWDWEGGCGSGGVNIECHSTAGDSRWDNIDIGIDGQGSDIPNWQVHSFPKRPLACKQSRGNRPLYLLFVCHPFSCYGPTVSHASEVHGVSVHVCRSTLQTLIHSKHPLV